MPYRRTINCSAIPDRGSSIFLYLDIVVQQSDESLSCFLIDYKDQPFIILLGDRPSELLHSMIHRVVGQLPSDTLPEGIYHELSKRRADVVHQTLNRPDKINTGG